MDLGDSHQARAPLFLLVNFFRALYLPLYQNLLQNQFICRSKMSTVCVCATVKIQFDNISTCKYSVILALRSFVMLQPAFGPPHSKISDLRLIGD